MQESIDKPIDKLCELETRLKKFIPAHAQRLSKLENSLREFEQNPVQPDFEEMLRRGNMSVKVYAIKAAIDKILTPRLTQVSAQIDSAAIGLARQYEEERLRSEEKVKELEKRAAKTALLTGISPEISMQPYFESISVIRNKPAHDILLSRGLRLLAQEKTEEPADEPDENVREIIRKTDKHGDVIIIRKSNITQEITYGQNGEKVYRITTADKRIIVTGNHRTASLIVANLEKPLSAREQVIASFRPFDSDPNIMDQYAKEARDEATEDLERAGFKIVQPTPGRTRPYVIVDKNFVPPVITVDSEGAISVNGVNLNFITESTPAVIKLLAENAASAISSRDILYTAQRHGFRGRAIDMIENVRKALNDNQRRPQIVIKYGTNGYYVWYGLNTMYAK